MLFCLSCKDHKTTNSGADSDQKQQIYTETIKSDLLIITEPEIEPEPEKVKESIPDGEFDKYFLSIKDSIVSLCCLESLYNPLGYITKNDISRLLPDYEIITKTEDNLRKTIFTKGNNSVCLVRWQSEYSNDYEIGLGKGQLTDSKIRLTKGIKIGMAKKDFINYFFQFSDSTINKINRISACEDPRGETFTQYLFTNDTLSIIKFGEWEE